MLTCLVKCWLLLKNKRNKVHWHTCYIDIPTGHTSHDGETKISRVWATRDASLLAECSALDPGLPMSLHLVFIALQDQRRTVQAGMETQTADTETVQVSNAGRHWSMSEKSETIRTVIGEGEMLGEVKWNNSLCHGCWSWVENIAVANLKNIPPLYCCCWWWRG